MHATGRMDGDSESAAGESPAGQLGPVGAHMGFGSLLRTWRRAAGLNQIPVARVLDMGVRTYRKIERGATPPRFSREQCDALAGLLRLDRDARHALLLHNVGASFDASPPEGNPRLCRAMQLLINRQMPSPTYLCDRNWNIIAYNTAMAQWWPWVREPGANLMRWALLAPEARTQYQDWTQHACVYVRMLKFAQARPVPNPELHQLVDDVRQDPEVQAVWDNEHDLAENRDGHVFRMSVPALGGETVEVVSHVLYPASMPDHRFVVITWIEDDTQDEGHDALGGERNAWAEESTSKYETHDTPADAHTLTARLVVNSPEEAAALAGPSAVPLPVLSRLHGPDVRLTLSPDTHSVIQAVQEAAGEWAVSEADASTVAARFPYTTLDEAHAEMKLLTRAELPSEPAAAADHIQQMLPRLEHRIRLLREVHHDLSEIGR